MPNFGSWKWRGFLSGQIKRIDDLPEYDFRRGFPRFQREMFHKNLELVKVIEAMAEAKNVAPSQLALAWIETQKVPVAEREGDYN